MFTVLFHVVTGLLTTFLYMFVFLCVFLIGLKLWLEPVKGVCKCKAKLNGRVAVVTGGNSGIGLETARDLAKRGAKVIIACRDAVKSEQAIADIIESTGNTDVEYRYLDLSKFSVIRKFAENFNKSVDRLDILVNNAGCAGLTQRASEDGIDLVMQINHFGPFLLTNLLLEKLRISKPSRIVIVSSIDHRFAQFDPEDLAGLKIKGYWNRYATSKLYNVLWTKALAKRLPNGVTVNCLHPGVVNTDIYNKMHPVPRTIIYFAINALFKTAKEGAQTSIHLCVAPELENASGLYYADCKPTTPSSFVKDASLVGKVWEESVRLTQEKQLFTLK